MYHTLRIAPMGIPQYQRFIKIQEARLPWRQGAHARQGTAQPSARLMFMDIFFNKPDKHGLKIIKFSDARNTLGFIVIVFLKEAHSYL